MFAAALARKRSRRPSIIPTIEPDNSHPIETIPVETDAEFALEMLMLDGTWQRRRVVWTKDDIAFARVGQNIQLDRIPLTEVLLVRSMEHEQKEIPQRRKFSLPRRSIASASGIFPQNSMGAVDGTSHHSTGNENSDLFALSKEQHVSHSDRLRRRKSVVSDLTRNTSKKADAPLSLNNEVLSAAVEGRSYVNTLQIQTIPDGFNSGRTYYMRAQTESMCETIAEQLSTAVVKAKKRAQTRTQLMKLQKKTRRLYCSLLFQGMIGMFITLNFIVNIIDVQIERDNPYHVLISKLDYFFTSLFTVELLINLFAHWLIPFLSNGWNLFDSVVIILSLVALGPVNLPISVLRLVRAFRVIRLFGRMRQLKRILSALSASIIPELNALMIMFIVISIYCILGVTFFGDDAPDSFGAFDLAFITMFRVAGGEPWPWESLPAKEGDGSTNFGVILFFFSYIVLVNWTLLQACVAVMIDNFISSSAQAQITELELLRDEEKKLQVIRNSLDPLLDRLLKDYTDERDLTSRLLTLFKVLDADGSNSVSCDELCVGIKKLVTFSFANFHPLLISAFNFKQIQYLPNGALCDPNGTLGFNEFEVCMREQIRFYAQRKLSESLVHDSFTAPEFAQIGAIKVILHELLRSSESVRESLIGSLKSEKENNLQKEQVTGAPAAESAHTQILKELQSMKAELLMAFGNNRKIFSDSKELLMPNSLDEVSPADFEPTLVTPVNSADFEIRDLCQVRMLKTEEEILADVSKDQYEDFGSKLADDKLLGQRSQAYNHSVTSCHSDIFSTSLITGRQEVSDEGLFRNHDHAAGQDSLLCNSNSLSGPLDSTDYPQDLQRNELLKGAGSKFSVTVAKGEMTPMEFIQLQVENVGDKDLHIINPIQPQKPIFDSDSACIKDQSTEEACLLLTPFNHSERNNHTSEKVSYTLKSSLGIIQNSTSPSVSRRPACDFIVHPIPLPVAGTAVARSHDNSYNSPRSNCSGSSTGRA